MAIGLDAASVCCRARRRCGKIWASIAKSLSGIRLACMTRIRPAQDRITWTRVFAKGTARMFSLRSATLGTRGPAPSGASWTVLVAGRMREASVRRGGLGLGRSRSRGCRVMGSRKESSRKNLPRRAKRAKRARERREGRVRKLGKLRKTKEFCLSMDRRGGGFSSGKFPLILICNST
jgi:hypothetical protein